MSKINRNGGAETDTQRAAAAMGDKQSSASITHDEDSKTGTRAKKLIERDLLLFKFIGTNGIASVHQLHRLFNQLARAKVINATATVKFTTCRARLAQLEAAGFLQRYRIDTRVRGELTFVITPKAAAEFTSQERKRFIVGLPAPHELYQQLIAADTRLMLEEQYAAEGFTLLNWKHERELRREQKLKQLQTHTTQFINPLKSSAENGQGNSSMSWKPLGRKSQSQLEIADAETTFINRETGEVRKLLIEVDGQYYGRMLRSKLTSFADTKKSLLWVTDSTRRAEHVRMELLARPEPITNIQVLVVKTTSPAPTSGKQQRKLRA